MIVQTFGKNIPIVVFKQIISEYDISSMLKEIKSFIDRNLLFDPDHTSSAVNEFNQYKNNLGVFVDDQYTERGKSSILRTHSKVNKIILSEICDKHVLFKYFSHTNWHSTLLSVYVNGGSYFEHNDRSVITSITYLWNQPKGFNGGEIFFSEYDLLVDPEIGDIIIFPGFVNHEVKEVKQDGTDIRYGRYSISQFFQIR